MGKALIYIQIPQMPTWGWVLIAVAAAIGIWIAWQEAT